jgi:hypothetical protein
VFSVSFFVFRVFSIGATKMAKMNVSRQFFVKCIMESVISTPDGDRIDPEKLARKSGLKLQSAKLRLSQWTKKYEDAGVQCPWPPVQSEGRGAKKLDLGELALLAAQFAPQEDGDEEDEEGGDE